MHPSFMTQEQLASTYQSDLAQGLTGSKAALLLAHNGPNEIPVIEPPSYWHLFVAQFRNPLMYMLLGAAAIIFVFEAPLDALTIAAILILNALVGTYQEGRADRLVAALRSFVATSAVVVRDGREIIVPARELVVGDIILIQAGDAVPANARVIESDQLMVDESMVSGESTPVHKDATPIPLQDHYDHELSLFLQKNMLLGGTMITRGSGRAIIVATGIQSFAGELQQRVSDIEVDVPLKHDIEHLAHILALYAIGLCVILIGIGLFQGMHYQSILSLIAALFICIVPEGLPVMVTLVLAMGVSRMARKKALVKRFAALEALGRVDVLAIDKTGTLTHNQMSVTKIISCDAVYTVSSDLSAQKQSEESLVIGRAASFARIAAHTRGSDSWRYQGDPIDIALAQFAQSHEQELGIAEETYEIIRKIPFDSTRLISVTLARCNGAIDALILGAPEVILAHSSQGEYQTDEEFPRCRATLERHVNELFSQGYRLVAGARVKNFSCSNEDSSDEIIDTLLNSSKLALVCAYGFSDPVRADAAQAALLAHQQGLELVMITGDHVSVAGLIAQQVGNIAKVHARVTPFQKLDIINSLKRAGHIVAMTGDGINDAPSLAAADVGIAMGRSGTDLAKQAASILLLDDSLTTLVQAIAEGRHVVMTLRRVIIYFLATNGAEVLVILCAMLWSGLLPFTPMQVLWLNFMTDGMLALALAMDPVQNGTPRLSGSLIDSGVLWSSLRLGAVMALSSFILFMFYVQDSAIKARTMVFVSLSLSQCFGAWRVRRLHAERESRVTSSPRNWWLILACGVVVCFYGVATGFDLMRNFFGVMPLTVQDWLFATSVSALVLLVS